MQFEARPQCLRHLREEKTSCLQHLIRIEDPYPEDLIKALDAEEAAANRAARRAGHLRPPTSVPARRPQGPLRPLPVLEAHAL